jgi:prepilin-type N-terminal cleavage/methylation domain-containing protein
MTLFRKITYKFTGRLKAFSLIEVLVAIFIIGVVVVSTLSVFVNMNRYLFQDKDLQAVNDFSQRYLFSLYLDGNLKERLFTASEISNLNRSRIFPMMLKPEETNITPNIRFFINRKIERWDPLLVNIGLEALVNVPESKRTGAKTRQYWIETTLSESYLVKLK